MSERPQERYDFEIVIGYRVEADNKHDALQAALDAEASLNDSSLRGSYGGRISVVRSKAPTLRRFLKSKRALPAEPVERDVRDEIDRRHAKLDPLLDNWRVRFRYQDGKEYEYVVKEPTREAAIDAARLKCYHETAHTKLTLISIEAED